MIVFNIEERQRVRIVDYDGLVKVDQSAIEGRLKEKGISIRLDNFVEQGKHKELVTKENGVYAKLHRTQIEMSSLVAVR